MTAPRAAWFLALPCSLALLLVLGIGRAPAQDRPADKGPKPADNGGEAAPAETARTEKAAGTIFDYKQEIGLSDQQVADIRQAVEALVKQARLQQARLVIAADELETLNSAEADLKDIRAKLMEIATLQVDMRYNDIATSRKINGLMTPAQLAKWKKIQEQARAQGDKGGK